LQRALLTSPCRHKLPDELSITGVDNTDLCATRTSGLGSVATPIREIEVASP